MIKADQPGTLNPEPGTAALHSASDITDAVKKTVLEVLKGVQKLALKWAEPVSCCQYLADHCKTAIAAIEGGQTNGGQEAYEVCDYLRSCAMACAACDKDGAAEASGSFLKAYMQLGELMYGPIGLHAEKSGKPKLNFEFAKVETMNSE